MKVVQINIVCDKGSTGKICTGISRVLNNENIENYILYSIGKSENPNAIKCTEKWPKLQALLSRIKGNYGFNSVKTTKSLISRLEKIKPDIVHLHNMHGHNCHLEILLEYLQNSQTKVIWTFHDCWTYTGYCPHYVMANCYKWKKGCHDCVQVKKFSWFIDNSSILYDKKKKAFETLDFTIATPSKWLAEEVRQSFLCEKPIQVVNNGIDLTVFEEKETSFREQYKIGIDEYVVLGVAIQWVERKGPDIFAKLAECLDDKKYRVVMVGTDENIEKLLPENIITIRKTESVHALAEIYSAADLFINPTREEVFGLVNVEALACGTPVVTFNTGGSPECIDETCGSVVEVDDFEGLKNEIIRICETKPYSKEACIKRARQFDQNDKYLEYYELYKEVLNSKE